MKNTPEPLLENDRKISELYAKPDYEGRSEEIQALYRERWRLQDEYQSYFCLSIGGMGRYCHAMEQIGMVEWGGDPPAWPELAAFNVPTTKVTYNGKEYDEPDEESPEHKAYTAACDEVRSWTDVDVIAGHKVYGTNDGWWVKPSEIAKALDRYYAWKKDGHSINEIMPGDEEYWDKWISFLETATEGGGFTVH